MVVGGARHCCFGIGVPQIVGFSRGVGPEDFLGQGQAAEICRSSATDAAAVEEMAAAIGHVLSQHWIVLADIEGVADLRDERVGDGRPAKAVGRDGTEQAVPLF